MEVALSASTPRRALKVYGSGDLVGDLRFKQLELLVVSLADSLGCLRNGGFNRGVYTNLPLGLLRKLNVKASSLLELFGIQICSIVYTM